MVQANFLREIQLNPRPLGNGRERCGPVVGILDHQEELLEIIKDLRVEVKLED